MQEMANPLVRPHLAFYPEDAGKSVNGYSQSAHWREEADPHLLTPMAVIGNQHYYVFEPCLLHDYRVCVPVRWFIRQRKLFAKAWTVRSVSQNDARGWIVEEYNEIEVSQDEFLVSFGSWNGSRPARNLPHASQIFGAVIIVIYSMLFICPSIGSLQAKDGLELPWTHTDPSKGNRWRILAEGVRVYSFPIWLYCDDTSGNVSKRWNKHNSFLFTAAGLPHSQANQEYNVHFLCTSNTAPPLEMLDGILDQLEYVNSISLYVLPRVSRLRRRSAWETGIWAWDCVHSERVLVLPFVVALPADNPMQSEFACHIGLKGKLFCRVCTVQGGDGEKPPSMEDDQHRDRESEHGSESEQEHPKQAKQRLESMAEMIDRISRFTRVRVPCY